MPTRKPRIQVTLNPHVYETITRMAQLQKRSRSAVVAEIIEAVHAPLMRTAALLEATAEAPKQVREGLLRTMESMERQMVSAGGAGLAQMDWLLKKIGDNNSTIGPKKRGVAGGASKDISPPIVTRGSGFRESKENKELGSKRKGVRKSSKKTKKGGKNG